jgi:hypothetical protein
MRSYDPDSVAVRVAGIDCAPGYWENSHDPLALPEPPENPAFLDLPDDLQDLFAGRFVRGIKTFRARVDAMDRHADEVQAKRAIENRVMAQARALARADLAALRERARLKREADYQERVAAKVARRGGPRL